MFVLTHSNGLIFVSLHVLLTRQSLPPPPFLFPWSHSRRTSQKIRRRSPTSPFCPPSCWLLLQSASAAARGKGTPTRRSFAQVMVWSGAKGVQTQPAPFPLILAPFITDLDPFKALAMSVAAAKPLCCRRQGQGGASTTISPLSLLWIVRMTEQDKNRNYFET